MEVSGNEPEAKGALSGFTALFENPKQAKQADAWRRFFLSKEFLGSSFRKALVKGCKQMGRGD